MNRTVTAGLALGLLVSSASAQAAQSRTPFWNVEEERETELSFTDWDTPVVVERKRSFGRKAAIFHADPQEIASDRLLVFEVESEGEVRWRCIAVDDVAECLGAPVRIPYRKPEEIVRLKVKAVPRESPRGNELVREAKQNRESRFIARK